MIVPDAFGNPITDSISVREIFELIEVKLVLHRIVSALALEARARTEGKKMTYLAKWWHHPRW